MKPKLIIFDIDDVLYDATLQKNNARENAVRAMLDAGLPLDFETVFQKLMQVVNQFGEDYGKHFDETLKQLGVKPESEIIAAAVVSYHDTKRAYLKPFPGIFQLLIGLRERGVKLAVYSPGPPMKDWEKLIRLSLNHLFHHVEISEINPDGFLDICRKCDSELKDAVYITANPEHVRLAKKAEIKVVRIRRGKYAITESPEADHQISNTTEILQVLF